MVVDLVQVEGFLEIASKTAFPSRRKLQMESTPGTKRARPVKTATTGQVACKISRWRGGGRGGD